MKLIKRIVRSPYVAGEVFARALQWVFPLVFGLLLSSSDLASAILYISWYTIFVGVLTIGQDKWLLVINNKDKYVISFYSVIITTLAFTIIILFVKFVFITSLPNITTVLFFIVAALGGAIQRLNVAVLRVEENGGKYLKYRVCINSFRLLCFSLGVYWFDVLGITVLILIDCFIMMINLIFHRSLDRVNSLSIKKTSRAYVKTSLAFGLAVAVSVLFSNLSLHFGRLFLGERGEPLELAVYTLSYVLGASISFVFSAIAVQAEPVVYKKDNFIDAAASAHYAMVAMFKAWCLFFPLILVISVIYESMSETPIDFYILVGTLFSFVILPVWHKASYLIAYMNKAKYLSYISLLAATVNIFCIIVTYQYFGLYGLVLASILSNALLAFAGGMYVKRSA